MVMRALRRCIAAAQAMLSASACYNILGCAFKLNTQVLRRIDHGCIYIMIAVRGTALPRCAPCIARVFFTLCTR